MQILIASSLARSTMRSFECNANFTISPPLTSNKHLAIPQLFLLLILLQLWQIFWNLLQWKLRGKEMPRETNLVLRAEHLSTLLLNWKNYLKFTTLINETPEFSRHKIISVENQCWLYARSMAADIHINSRENPGFMGFMCISASLPKSTIAGKEYF